MFSKVLLGILFGIFLYSQDTELLSPSFWLSKIPSQGATFNTKISFNSSIYSSGYLVRPLNHGHGIPGRYVVNMIQDDLNWFNKFPKYGTNNEKLTKLEFDTICNINKIPKIVDIAFGLITTPTQVKAFPTNLVVMIKRNDFYFNILDKVFLDIGDEVSILSKSADGKWGLVESRVGHGWIKLEDVGVAKKSIVSSWVYSNKIVAINRSNFLYSDEHYTNKVSTIMMGTSLVYITNCIVLPIRKVNGDLSFRCTYSSAFSLPLKQTYSNLAIQAFKLLDTPYSWGKMDCSEYIRRVFLTVGIELPRSSFWQMKSLPVVWTYSDQKVSNLVLDKLVPFRTLFYLEGPCHIMFYLGKHEGKYYALHNSWDITTKTNSIVIRKVTITSIDLESTRGSYRSRIKKLVVFK